jgi:DNA-binding transcriptional regulator YdaS (Cro superfamily)
VYPATDAAGLIEAAGGAATVAALLGVGRATVYHWRSGTRPMPADAAQRLAGALADPATPTAATAPATPAATPLRFTAPPIPGDHDDA